MKNEFIEVIKNYMKNVTNKNDLRIMNEAVNILEAEMILNNEELDVLNELFISLREDYTLFFMQDRETLEFLLAIKKQEIPIIENKHNLNILACELKRMSLDKNISKLEKTVLTFLDACEHIEENEVISIQKIMEYINNNWTLKPIEEYKYNDETVRCSKIVPSYQKKFIKMP